MHTSARFIAFAVLLTAVLACSKTETRTGHRSFDTPEAAASALIEAIESGDSKALRYLLGPGSESIVSSGDDATDRKERAAFTRMYRATHRFVAGTPNHLILQVGEERFPLAIPLIRRRGEWRFDGAAGVAEIAARRIGRNELQAIDVMRGYALSQSQQPATAPLAAPESERGYVYRTLPPRGQALIGIPQAYGSTGIMTFVVSSDGVIWQRDLGDSTTQLANAIQTFAPDDSWTPLTPE